MAKRKKYESWQTTDSDIKSVLQRVWLWSNERDAAIARDDKTCVECGKRKSQAKGREVKIEVHHKKISRWDKIIKVIREELLTHPDNLEVLCKSCHNKLHGRKEKK